MCQLIETIKIQDGVLFNISWHNYRLNQSRRKLYKDIPEIYLEQQISIPKEYLHGEIRCRIIYGREIERTEFYPYSYRKVHTLKMIEDNLIKYELKYADRTRLEKLYTQRGECDDILIIRNGLFTDSFSANLVFYDGVNYYTPETPLLQGTKREKYLSEKIIISTDIRPSDLPGFREIHLINAFQDIGRTVIPVTSVS